MKKKERKKLVIDILHEMDIRKRKIAEKNKKRSYMTESMEKSEEPSGSEACEYDSDVSDKFKKMVYNLIKYPDNLSLSFDTSNININIEDIKQLKSVSTNYNNNKISNGDCRLHITIYKNSTNTGGFTMTQGYNKHTKYLDPKIYDDIISDIKDRVKSINSENFNGIWDNVARESGILRDSNLDDLLDSVD